MINNDSKLIVIRGQSGSGKSTVSVALQECAIKPIVLFEPDHYKHFTLKMISDSDDMRKLLISMLVNNVDLVLREGYDCIVNGTFSNTQYQKMFEDIFSRHPNNNYMYYYNNSFEETLKRHETRDKKHQFGKDEMKEWYFETPSYGHSFEKIIPEEYSLDQTVDMILQDSKLTSN